jgi:hypothetical protein
VDNAFCVLMLCHSSHCEHVMSYYVLSVLMLRW